MTASRRIAALAASAVVIAATLVGAVGVTAQEPVTIEWWNNADKPPRKDVWAWAVEQFEAANPGITIDNVPMQNEDFQTKIPLALNSDSPPDLYQSWGGGGLAEQVAAGKVMDITDAVAPWIDTINPGAATIWQVDGRQYGIPYDLGVVGMWYNKDLLAKAGITEPPATWTELLAAIEALKAAGITPIAVGEGDPWTGAFWWEYIALRLCGSEKMLAAVKARSLADPCFVEAGTKMQELLAAEPFQEGFLATPAQVGAGSASALLANEKAAMELMGQWEPAVMVPLTDPAGGLPTEKLGWFPFPAIEGGAGVITDYIGGGDGFAVSASAPPETVEFLKYLVSPEVATKWATDVNGLPVTVGTESSVTDPNMAELLKNRANATFVQLYLDQAFPAAVGAAVNEAVQGLFAGQLTPQQAVDNINAVAATS
jgi:raffinose/stachyose/melibiose transport system substrate-binding protein